MTRDPWSTACPDWQERLLAGRSLVPPLPLFRREAERGLNCFKRLRLSDVIGTPRMDEACGEWFFDVVEALFGCYDPALNERMISEIFLLIPKGNSKSTNGGAIMVTALLLNRRPEAEFLFVAPTMEIAAIAYRQAKGTIRLDPTLSKMFHVQDNLRRITDMRDETAGSMLMIKAADTDVITGSKAVGTMIDETHVFAKRGNAKDVFVELRGALTKRRDGFLFQTTTQSKDPPSGVFLSELETARAVRDGKMRLPLLPVLYELPPELTKDDGWKNRKFWPIVNPNLGRSTHMDFLERAVVRAEGAGLSDEVLVASQHFNVQIGVALRADGWAGQNVWERGVDESLRDLDALLDRVEVATVGVDGGGLDDLLGVAVIGRERITKRWLGWTHALISDIGIKRRHANRDKYDAFEADGDLTKFDYVAPSDVSAIALAPNIKFVVDIVRRVQERALLAQVGVDAAGIGAIVDALAGIGVTQDAETLDAVGQGIRLMGAIKAIEIRLAGYTFLHGGTRMMAWCVGNLVVVPTPTAMRVARDAAGYGKIDPIMALFNAAHLMALEPEAPGISVFDQLAAALPDDAQTDAEAAQAEAEADAILRDPLHPLWQATMNRRNAELARHDRWDN